MRKTKIEKKHSFFRRIIQIFFAALFNGYAIGFFKGKIFTGKTKSICLPVLNCYSCPGAAGACPIGSLQAVMGSHKYKFSFYVIGTIMLFGVIFGRLICGFLCPFGLIQDLLHKVPVPKLKRIPKRIDKPMRYLKYIILTLTLLLPILLTNKFGMSSPYFCKWICPAGSLEGGIPLLLTNENLKNSIGFIFQWKLTILLIVIIACVFVNRFFCKYLCPLGAFYSLFNKLSLYQIKLDKNKCVNCKKCNTVCPMDLDVIKDINSAECIKCGKCKATCNFNAISTSFCVVKTEKNILSKDKRKLK